MKSPFHWAESAGMCRNPECNDCEKLRKAAPGLVDALILMQATMSAASEGYLRTRDNVATALERITKS